MTLVALDGTPLIPIGSANRGLVPSLGNPASVTLDAANEAVIMWGRVYNEDRGSHTIDTTGSSSLGWRCGAITFANGGTTVKVGIADLDAGAGPPARAVNASDVITMDVSASLTGGSGITASSWNEHVPTAGTKTIAHGDLVAFCVQMTARGGADSVTPQVVAISAYLRPGVTSFTGGSYTNFASSPNCVITYADGTIGSIFGGFVINANAATTIWNNTSGTKEYGNYFSLPFPVTVYGLYGQLTPSGDCDAVLYGDPFGTPTSLGSVSLDLNIATANSASFFFELFATGVDLAANTACGAIFKPTSATNVSAVYKTMNAAAHQKTETIGTGYAISRNTGAFAAVNSQKDRYAIGLLVGAFDNGAGAGGSGMIVHPGTNGRLVV